MSNNKKQMSLIAAGSAMYTRKVSVSKDPDFLKVVDLNKGRLKVINKVEKGIKPSWNTKDIASSFVGSKRGGSPVVKVNSYTYLGIGHKTEYFNSKYKFLGSKHKAFVYLFDFKKNNYYTNHLTKNQLGWLDCFGAELVNKGNKIRFDFIFSSNFVSHILSNIYLFDIKLDTKKLIKIARKGKKKYFKRFNEIATAKYIVDISIGKINNLYN